MTRQQKRAHLRAQKLREANRQASMERRAMGHITRYGQCGATGKHDAKRGKLLSKARHNELYTRGAAIPVPGDGLKIPTAIKVRPCWTLKSTPAFHRLNPETKSWIAGGYQYHQKQKENQ